MLDQQTSAEPTDLGRRVLLMSELWGAVAIAFMWAAVLFAAIYGGDFTSVNTGSQSTTIPSAVFVALFACIATASVAKRAFGRSSVRTP
jgi:F0F1-type ATP synthase assembly protein I